MMQEGTKPTQRILKEVRESLFPWNAKEQTSGVRIHINFAHYSDEFKYWWQMNIYKRYSVGLPRNFCLGFYLRFTSHNDSCLGYLKACVKLQDEDLVNNGLFDTKMSHCKNFLAGQTAVNWLFPPETSDHRKSQNTIQIRAHSFEQAFECLLFTKKKKKG